MMVRERGMLIPMPTSMNLISLAGEGVSVHLRGDKDESFNPLDIHIHVPKERKINIKLPEDGKKPQVTEKPIEDISTPLPKIASTDPFEGYQYQYPESEELEPETLELEPEEPEPEEPELFEFLDESGWNAIMTDKPKIPMVTKKPASIVEVTTAFPEDISVKPEVATTEEESPESLPFLLPEDESGWGTIKTDKPQVLKMTRRPAYIIEVNTASPEVNSALPEVAKTEDESEWGTIKTDKPKLKMEKPASIDMVTTASPEASSALPKTATRADNSALGMIKADVSKMTRKPASINKVNTAYPEAAITEDESRLGMIKTVKPLIFKTTRKPTRIIEVNTASPGAISPLPEISKMTRKPASVVVPPRETEGEIISELPEVESGIKTDKPYIIKVTRKPASIIEVNTASPGAISPMPEIPKMTRKPVVMVNTVSPTETEREVISELPEVATVEDESGFNTVKPKIPKMTRKPAPIIAVNTASPGAISPLPEIPKMTRKPASAVGVNTVPPRETERELPEVATVEDESGINTVKPKIPKMTRKPAPIIEVNTATPEKVVTTAMELGNFGWSTIETEEMKEILGEIDPTLSKNSIDQIVGSLDKVEDTTYFESTTFNSLLVARLYFLVPYIFAIIYLALKCVTFHNEGCQWNHHPR